jgi:hypothetical protein
VQWAFKLNSALAAAENWHLKGLLLMVKYMNVTLKAATKL